MDINSIQKDYEKALKIYKEYPLNDDVLNLDATMSMVAMLLTQRASLSQIMLLVDNGRLDDSLEYIGKLLIEINVALIAFNKHAIEKGCKEAIL